MRILKPSDKDIEDQENSKPRIHDLEVSWWNWLVWRFFDKSVPPFSGGFMEQPVWVIEDLMTIEAEFNDVQEQLDDR